MAYCRFSTNDFKCQLYVFQSDRGYEIYTAGNKILGDIPHVPPLSTLDPNDKDSTLNFTRKYREQMDFIESAERAPLPFPSAGMSFTEPDAEHCIARLHELRAEGFEFPDYVFESLEEELIASQDEPDE